MCTLGMQVRAILPSQSLSCFHHLFPRFCQINNHKLFTTYPTIYQVSIQSLLLFLPLDKPVTHITSPENGAFDRTTVSDPIELAAGDIGPKVFWTLNEGNGEDKPPDNLEQPLLFITSTPPITTNSTAELTTHNDGLLGGKKRFELWSKTDETQSGEEELQEPRNEKEEWEVFAGMGSLYWKAKIRKQRGQSRTKSGFWKMGLVNLDSLGLWTTECKGFEAEKNRSFLNYVFCVYESEYF